MMGLDHQLIRAGNDNLFKSKVFGDTISTLNKYRNRDLRNNWCNWCFQSCRSSEIEDFNEIWKKHNG